MILSSKLEKLRYLLQNSKLIPRVNSMELVHQGVNSSPSQKHLIENKISRNLPLYLSLVKKPLNLLFSMDQFVFEFSKKSYQQKKTGDFFRELKERKKLSLFYGHLNRKQIVNLFNQVKKKKGYFSKNVFSVLERRLDVVLYRSAFTKTIAEARQLIKHNKVFVNQQIINVPSYSLNPGDFLSISSKTGDTLKNKLLGSKRTQRVQNYPKIVGDFYSKVKKTLDSSLTYAKSRECLSQHDSSQPFRSKLLCKFFIHLLCTKIKARSYWNLVKERVYLNDMSLEISQKQSFTTTNKVFLTMFKWKSCSKKKPFFFQKFTKKNSGGPGASFRRKTNQEEIVYANGGCLQKKPVFWSLTYSDFNKKNTFPNSQQSQQTLRHESKNQAKNSKLKNKNLVFYRKSFLLFLKHLEKSEKFTSFLTLSMKKILFKKYRQNSKFFHKFFFRNQRPLNIEVSYNLLNVVYLYSPQRVNFPFSIDIDFIQKSLR
uniref:30S ribosomal protein S4 n=1 Tax=Micractinium pusillum TaxID=126839 RepID=A0A650F1U5_9CHLO|nr:30S ribosomal protein S4 [Micractinium pusillum]